MTHHNARVGKMQVLNFLQKYLKVPKSGYIFHYKFSHYTFVWNVPLPKSQERNLYKHNWNYFNIVIVIYSITFWNLLDISAPFDSFQNVFYNVCSAVFKPSYIKIHD